MCRVSDSFIYFIYFFVLYEGGTLSSGEGSSRKISIPIGHGFSKRNFNGTKSLIEIENNDVILRNIKGPSQPITLHE